MRKIILRTCCLAAGFGLAVSLTVASPAPPNLQRALEVQQTLAAQRPSDADTLNDLGNLLLLAGRLGEAESAYRRAIELDAQHAGYYYNLALLLDRRGDGAGARKALEEAVRLDPEHAWAFYQLGTVLHGQGLVNAAVKAYAEALFLDPNLASSRVNPHVIENPLLTEAMILAYRKTSTQPLAPRDYEDPQRIAELMVQLEFTDDQRAAGEPASDTSARPDRPRSTMAPGDEEAEGALDEDAEERARSGGGSLTVSGSTVGADAATSDTAPGTRVRGLTTRSLRTEPNAGGAAPNAVRPPRGTRYVPRSTGSLELQLLPGPGQQKDEDRQT